MSFAYLAVFAVCFLASLLGPLCGIGGGVIIKPVVDAMGVMGVSTVSFLSSLSVLIMSISTLAQDIAGHSYKAHPRDLLPVALGSAAGGVIGKALFTYLESAFPDPQHVGAAQALVLILLSVLVLVYTFFKSRIRGFALKSPFTQGIIGSVAGACWSFLGIGGGPFNLALLVFFFSMPTRMAAQASIFIIAFSQTAAFLYTLATGAIPAFSLVVLIGMALMAILGSVAGRRIARAFDGAATDRLYVATLLLIIVLSCYNFARFSTL